MSKNTEGAMADPQDKSAGRANLFGIDFGALRARQDAYNRALGNTFTAGLLDKLDAAVRASAEAMHGGNWSDAYNAARTQQATQSVQDQQQYPVSHDMGQAMGLLGGLSAADTPALKAAGEFKRLAPLMDWGDKSLSAVVRALRPPAAVAAAGAGASIIGQSTQDGLTHHLSSPQTYVADAAGGAANTLGTMFGSPSIGSLADATVGEGVYSALTGQPFRVDDVAQNAVLGGYMGAAGHKIGHDATNSLPRKQKGDLGESIAQYHLNLLGDGVNPTAKRSFDVSGGRTIADHVTTAGDPVEAKFGNKAKLRPRQIEASRELPNYQILHYTPSDIGNAAGGLLGAFAVHPEDQDSVQWQPPSF